MKFKAFNAVLWVSLATLVRSASAAPTVYFQAAPTQIWSGQSTVLSWSGQNISGSAVYSINQGIGSVNDNMSYGAYGALAVSPSQTTTYTLTVQDDSGASSQSVTVTVQAPSGLCEEWVQPACAILKSLAAAGPVAGSLGDYYQNNDLQFLNPPQSHADAQTGLTALVRLTSQFPAPPYRAVTLSKTVIGNASVSWGGMSIVRGSYLQESYWADIAYQQYRNSNAYWYPALYDYGTNDTFHAMTPAVSNSDGFSASELDEVTKSFYTLAAFKPETKALLRSTGLLMPTLQMLNRRTRVASDAEYLTGKAHPTAFGNVDNWTAMMQMANAMQPDSVPPMVQLRMVDDTYSDVQGRDFFDMYSTQRLYDTPVSIARLWRGLGYSKHMRVTASSSFDVNQRPLTYTWVVLRGDPAHVRITPMAGDPSTVDIDLDYHPEAPVVDPLNPALTRLSSLVVIGCFVNNGIYYSAPGFVTSYTFPGEHRRYNAATHQIEEVDYQARSPLYMLSYDRLWDHDVFVYNAGGVPQGWWRYKGNSTTGFTPEGYQVVARDASGRVTQAINVTYFQSDSGQDWGTTGSPFSYQGNAVLPDAVPFQTVEAPTVTPTGGTFYDPDIPMITLQTATPGAEIRYEWGWDAPVSPNSPLYTSPFPLPAPNHFAVRAFKNGMNDSAWVQYDYDLLVSMPTISPAGGTFSGPRTVTLATPSPNAEIRYTTDGTDPLAWSGTVYSAATPLVISANTTLKVRGFKANRHDSPVATATFVINGNNQTPIASFTATPASGNAPLTVSFDASGSSDADGAVTGFSWNFGDGQTASGMTTSHLYTTAGSFTATLTVTDNNGGTASTTHGISVTAPANQSPTAANQSVSTNEDTAKPITLTGSDPEGQPLTYSVVSNPVHGTISGSGANRTYTPDSNYNGSDSFTFKANDGSADSNVATISITVNSINDSPIANFTATPTSGNAPLTVSFDASSSSDVDGLVTGFSWNFGDGQAGNGMTTSHLYTTAGNFTATLTVTDNNGGTASTTRGIAVGAAPNQAPTAQNQSISTNEDTAKPITLSGSDPENQPLTYTITSIPAHGALTGSGTNRTYTPNANFNGSDSFTFKVNDGVQDSNIATLSITVASVNDAPLASLTANPTSGIAPLTVSFNASGSSDIDGSINSFNWTFGDGQSGSGAAVSHVYTSVGNVTATLTVTDNSGATATTTRLISVGVPPNLPPTAQNQSVSTNQNTIKTIILAASDPEGQTLTYIIVSQPAHGTLAGSGTTRTYAPNTSFYGSDSFTFKVNDGLQDSNTGTVSIAIAPITNLPPIPMPDPLPTPDLSGLDHRTFTVRDELTIGYSGPDAQFMWEFEPISSPFAGSAHAVFPTSLTGIGASVIAPTMTLAPELSLASKSLAPGTYLVKVQAMSAGQTSAWASASITLVSADLAGVRIYPNPWRADKHSGRPITFNQLSDNCTVKIFTVSGHLVRDLGSASGQTTWDLKTDSGDPAASGLYFYLITDTQNNQTRGKLAVIR